MTSRLTATKLAREDLSDLVALHLDKEVSRFLGGVRTPKTTSDYLDANLQHWAVHGIGLWTLKTYDGAFVGRAGLRFVDLTGVQEFEVAYALGRSYWGLGIATEITQALVDIWKTRRWEASLIGIVMKGNSASERVLIKAGLSYERDSHFYNEVCGVYRLVR